MKKFKALFTSLALLLVCASSGFAVVIDAPWVYSDASQFKNGVSLDLQFGTDLNPAAPGTGTMNLHLDILAGNSWNSGWNLKQKFSVLGDDLTLPIYGAGVKVAAGTVFSYDLNVTPNKSGIYEFELFSRSTVAAADAYWSLNKAQLTNSEPSKTPLPAAILLFGSGLVGMFGVNKVRRRGSSAA